MKFPFPSVLLAACLLAALAACNDPTSIGSELLAEDGLALEHTDTFQLRAWSEPADSVKIYDPNLFATNIGSLPVGILLDPVFGTTTATAYAQVSLNSVAPSFLGGVLDSMVLVLPYDADLSYGNLLEQHTLDVYLLSEDLSDTTRYFSNRSFLTESDPVASTVFYPKVTDSVEVLVPNGDSMVAQKQVPQLRIPFDPLYSTLFFKTDTSQLNRNTEFQAFFKGMQLRPSQTTAGLVSYKLRDSRAGIWVYYKVDSVARSYQFPILSGDVVTAQYTHAYEGATLADFLETPEGASDSLLFLQGMSGTDVVLEIPYIDDLGDVVVNRAELVLPIRRLPGDDPALTPVPQVLVSELVTDSTTRVIDDISIAISRVGDSFSSIFGGDATAESDAYTINLSAHALDMIRGLSGKKMRISVYQKARQPQRVVLFGPAHPVRPATLRLSYTPY
ncbi:MAG: hypothetical protein RLY31_804 [Bacteroidota bacterium]